jgi:steroid 5-alpha reductase family enzyme
MLFLTLWFNSGLTILGLMFLLWLLSLILKNSSIVDIFWGLGFVIPFWVGTLLVPGGMTVRAILLGIMATIWGLRLSLYIFRRNYAQPEDFRYAAWRKEAGLSWWWRSFFKVFFLQGALMWIIAMPLLATQTSRASDSVLNWLDFLGIFIWLIGFTFEAGGDYQLSRFKADPANQGKLLTTGFWSVTRHPNYFGDAVQWWAFYFLAFVSGAWWTILSPLIMTYLLRNISGVALLEKTLKDSKPGYAEYIANTPAFFPRIFPRKNKEI